MKHLNNCIDLHPCHGTWKGYLQNNTNLVEEYNGYRWHSTSNRHYIVLPGGEVKTYFGYHGENAWLKIIYELTGKHYLWDWNTRQKVIRPDNWWHTE